MLNQFLTLVKKCNNQYRFRFHPLANGPIATSYTFLHVHIYHTSHKWQNKSQSLVRQPSANTSRVQFHDFLLILRHIVLSKTTIAIIISLAQELALFLILQAKRLLHIVTIKKAKALKHIYIHTAIYDKYKSTINHVIQAHQQRSNHFASQWDTKEEGHWPNKLQNYYILLASF